MRNRILGISKKSLAEIFPAFFLSDQDKLKVQNIQKVDATSRDHHSWVHNNSITTLNKIKKLWAKTIMS